ncbi:MAG TPA: glycosyltransferase family 39 protein [Candidatus Eisenbacteria bacterium]
MKPERPRRTGLAAAGVILLAAGLGLWGIGHGLPFSYYPDEAHVVKSALAFGSGDLNPHWFHKPAFFYYILFAEYGVVFLVGKLAGVWAGVADFGVQFVRDPGVFYAVGRLTALAFALATIAVVIRLGERHLRAGAGLLGALMLALTVGLIDSSQNVKEDVPSMFFAVLSLYWILNYAASGRLRDLVVGALAGGASAATKAYGLALVPVILAAVIWRPAPSRAEAPGAGAIAARCVAALALFVLAQFALAPFSFLDPLGRADTWSRVTSLFTVLGRMTGLLHVAPAPDENLSRHGGIGYGIASYGQVLVSRDGMGLVIVAYAALGAIALLLRRRFTDLLLLGYVAVFIAASVIVHPGYAEPRHQTPIYPVLAAAGGFAVLELAARLRIRTAWAVAVAAATLLWPLASVAQRAETVSREDTRSAAKRWIEERIPAGTAILLDEGGPQLLASERSLRHDLLAAKNASDTGQFTAHYDKYLELQLRAAREGTAYDVEEIRKPWWLDREPAPGVSYLTSEYDRDMGNPLRPVGVASYDSYLDQGFQYAVVQSERYGPVTTNPRLAADWPSFSAFYRELFRRGRLVREFSPASGAYTGPVVRIYRFAR